MGRAAVTRQRALEVVDHPDRAALLLHGTRRQLIQQLDTPQSAASLARRLGLPRQRLNYHLRELEREGLVELVEERKKGNCVERIVRASARAFVISPEALGAFAPGGETVTDRMSAAYLIASASAAVRDVAALEADARRQSKRLSTLTLDLDVRFATAEARADFAEELSGTIAALAAKYHNDHAAGGRRFHLLVAVHPSVDRTARKKP